MSDVCEIGLYIVSQIATRAHENLNLFTRSFRIPSKQVKILIYLVLVASDDVETQRKGMTTIVWPGTKARKGDEVGNLKFDRILFLKRVFECLPVRTCCLHFSFPSTHFFQVVRTLFILSMPSLMKRMKFHTGKCRVECVDSIICSAS